MQCNGYFRLDIVFICLFLFLGVVVVDKAEARGEVFKATATATTTTEWLKTPATLFFSLSEEKRKKKA